MQYTFNNTTLSYNALGETMRGENVVLLDQDVDLTSNTFWSDSGFSIQSLFQESLAELFSRRAYELLTSRWEKAGLKIPKNFHLSQYHTLIDNYQKHLSCVNETKLLSVKDFPGGVEALEDRVSEICGIPLVVKNPYDGQSIFHFRVIRPNSSDNNPLHRDVWLEDYESCINLYIPIAGSNEKSSLILIPESHRWPESRIERTKSGAVINDVRFNVPAVTSIFGDYSIARPSPKLNEVLVFSPYLIHGGAVNLNDDLTRISIEVRLWLK